jgi:hypothetical protein
VSVKRTHPIGRNRDRYHNGRLRPINYGHVGRDRSRCFAGMHRLRAKGWRVSWLYWRPSRRDGLSVMIIAKGAHPRAA